MKYFFLNITPRLHRQHPHLVPIIMSCLYILPIVLLISACSVESKLTNIKVPTDSGIDDEEIVDVVSDEIIQSSPKVSLYSHSNCYTIPIQKFPICTVQVQRQRPLPAIQPDRITPYNISNQLNQRERQIIPRYLSDIFRQTNNCSRFVPLQRQRDYVGISKPGNECFARLERMLGRNLMSIDAGLRSACSVGSVIKHEALNNLGFDHTHEREESTYS